MKNPILTALGGTLLAMAVACVWVPLRIEPALARQMDWEFSQSSLQVQGLTPSEGQWGYGPVWDAQGGIVVWWPPVFATQALILLLGGGLLTLVVRRERRRKAESAA